MMMATRYGRGTRGRTAALLTLGVLFAAALLSAGCVGGTTSDTGGGPGNAPTSEPGTPAPVPTEQTPSTTATPGSKQSLPGSSTAHVSDVEPDVYRQIVDDLKAQGFRMQSESELRMSYGDDKREATVSGRMSGPKDAVPGAETVTVGTVRVELEQGTWKATGTK